MIIKYSPDFTGEYYLDIPEGKCILGEIVVDDTGLLEAFELRLGLPFGGEIGQVRTIEYRRALEACKRGAFYERSFAVDSFGVASSLLSWRDKLLMLGWTPEKESGQERLDTLARVEKVFRQQSDCPGEPERWMAILSMLAGGRKPFSEEDTLELWYPEELLPGQVRIAISLSGIHVVPKREASPEEVVFSGKQVKLIKYTELTDAFEAFSGGKPSEGTVVINRDNVRFNSVLRRQGQALEQAATEMGNPAIPQIFKLGLSLLQRPMNPHTLLSFLQLPKGPVPYPLASDLADALLQDNGIGENWKKALGRHPNKQGEAKSYLLDLLKDRNDPAIPKDVAKRWCQEIVDWVEKRLRDENHPALPLEIPQYAALTASCQGMLRLMEYEGASLDATDFGNLVKSLCVGVSIRTDEAEVGSFDTVSSPAAILSDPAKLIWLDCNGVLDASWPYAFLTMEEVNRLKEMRIIVPSKERYFKYGFSLVTRLLSRVDDIVLVRSEYDCGEPLREHPAVTLARQAGIKETDGASPKWSGPQVMIQQRDNFDFGKDVLGTFSRQESASSIETLIDHPADYYLEYILKLKEIKDMELKDVTLARGLVAHLAFENLMDDGNKDVKAMRALLDGPDFRERVRAAAACKGATLLLGENEIDFEGFVVTLKDSFTVLLDILEASRLAPYATEFSLKDSCGNGVDLRREIGEVVTGSVDLIAKTAGGNYVVIDLKYPRSSGRQFTERLKTDTSVQLEIYSAAVSKRLGRPVLATAYYLMPLMRLYTCDTQIIFRGKGVYHEKKKLVSPDLPTRIRDGIKASRDCLRNGLVPLGEKGNFTFGRQDDTYEILKDRIK